ncbi:MAG: ComF family protein [Clostridia bacterium]|nr:ComF family protein [Clostridia bacterium]
MNRFVQLLRETISPTNTSCYICDDDAVVGGDKLCDTCRDKLRLCINPPSSPYLDGSDAGLIYTSELHRPMHRFKYRDRLEYGAFFSQYMQIPSDWEIELICPVPLHPVKELLRTYNQSEELAKYVSARDKIPYCRDLIRRTRYTKTQARRTTKQRQKNVRGAFLASKECKGLSVLLIDDIFTTGATLSACAKALKSAGAERVYALCACRAEG